MNAIKAGAIVCVSSAFIMLAADLVRADEGPFFPGNNAADRQQNDPFAFIWDEPVKRDSSLAVGEREGHPLLQALAGKLDIGLRVLHVKLKHPVKGEPFEGSFIGSIDKLEAKQAHLSPIRIYARYAFAPYAGAGFQMDRMEIRTLTTYHERNGSQGRETDGNIVMFALMPHVFVRYPNHTPFEPYGELGLAFYRNSFEPDDEWYADGRRNFLLENSTAVFWGIGLDYKPHRHCRVDLYLRSVNVEVDGLYVHRYIPEDEPFVFSTQHFAYGMSASYSF